MSTTARTLADDAGYAERWRLWEIAYELSSRKMQTRATIVFTIAFAAIVAVCALLVAL
jgi:hypothetical protein